MPLYEYQCRKCGSFEIIHKFADSPLSVCPKCGSAVEKLPSAPAFQFKGTGWYVTDYARKGAAGDGKSKDKDGPATPASAAKDAGAKDAGAKDAGGKDSGTGSASASAAKTDTAASGNSSK